jgi:hypothetical protein
MDTLIFIALFFPIASIFALYYDYQRPKRDAKSLIRLEKRLGNGFSLDEIVKYEIDKFGYYETKSNFRNIVDFMVRIGRDTSTSNKIFISDFLSVFNINLKNKIHQANTAVPQEKIDKAKTLVARKERYSHGFYNFEEAMFYSIEEVGYEEAHDIYNGMVAVFNNVGKDTSSADLLYEKYFGDSSKAGLIYEKYFRGELPF